MARPTGLLGILSLVFVSLRPPEGVYSSIRTYLVSSNPPLHTIKLKPPKK